MTMKHCFKILLTIIIILTLTINIGCEKKIDIIKKSDIESLPFQTATEVSTEYTDSGKVQLVLQAPVVEKYTNTKNPYSEFKEGLKVFFYDGHPEPVARLSSKYAKYMDDKRIWELKDSVIAINEKNEILETEMLYWDQGKDLVYTDRFVRITSEDQIVMGTGLEANSRFTKPRIRNVSAIIYISDEEEGSTGN
jgi:LPS export ABC transporter protein LptC